MAALTYPSSEDSPSRGGATAISNPASPLSSSFSTSNGRGDTDALVDQRGGAAAVTSSFPPSTSASSYLPAARSRLHSDLGHASLPQNGHETDSVDSHASSVNRIHPQTPIAPSRSASTSISHPSSLYQTITLSESLSRTSGDVRQALEDVLTERNKFCHEAGKLSSENVRIWNLMGRIRKENEALKARLSTGSSSAHAVEVGKPVAGILSGSVLRSASGGSWNLSSPSTRIQQNPETNGESGNKSTSPSKGKRPATTGSSTTESQRLTGLASIVGKTHSSPRAASTSTPRPSSPLGDRGFETTSSAGASTIAPGPSRLQKDVSPVEIPQTVSQDSSTSSQIGTTSASGGHAAPGETISPAGVSVLQQRAAAKALQQPFSPGVGNSAGSLEGEDKATATISTSDDVFGPNSARVTQRALSVGSHGEYTAVDASSIGGDDSIVEGTSRIATPQRFEVISAEGSDKAAVAGLNSVPPPLQPDQPSNTTPMRSIRQIRSASMNPLVANSSPSAWTDDTSESPIRSSKKDIGSMLGGGSGLTQSPLNDRQTMNRKPSTSRLEPRDATTGSTFSLAKALAEVASTGPPPGAGNRGTPQPRLNASLLGQVSVKIHGTNIRINERSKEVISLFLLVELAGPLPFNSIGRWMVEKLYSDVIALDATLKHRNGKMALKLMESCQVPDKTLFKDHAPSKVDSRRILLQEYFRMLCNISLTDKDDYCTFLCTDVVPLPSRSPTAMTKEGFLTKKGQNLGRWVTRLYSLENGDRLDYLDGRGGALLGSINLRGAQIGKQQKSQTSETDENSYRHAFLILERKGKSHGVDGAVSQGQFIRHVLCAETDEERDEWVDVLVRAIDERDKEKRAEVTSNGYKHLSPHVSAQTSPIRESAPVSSLSRAESPTKVGRQRRGTESSIPSPSSPVTGMNTVEPFYTTSRTSAPGPVPAILPSRPSRSGSLSRKLRPREGSGSGQALMAALGADDNLRRSRDGTSGRRGSGAAPEMPTNPDSLSAVISPRGQDTPAASPLVKERAAKAEISGPMGGAPIPPGYKFGNREEVSADSTSSVSKKDDKKRFWQRFGSNGGAGQPRPPVFGVPLTQAIAISSISPSGDDEAAIPSVVYRCIDFLERKGGMREEGIYRLSGSSTTVKALRDRFDTEGDVDLVKEMDAGEKGSVRDPHAVAGLLKTYLRQLPSSVLTREMHLDFLHVSEVVDKTERMRELAALVTALPRANYSLLRTLIQHLTKVTNHQDANKMTVRNVGIVFSPTLGIPAGLFALFLTTFEYCFGLDGSVPHSLPANFPASDEDGSEGIKHSQVLQAVAAAEEAGKFADEEVDSTTETVMTPTSRSNKRDSRMLHAVDFTKTPFTGSTMNDYPEEAEEAEQHHQSTLAQASAQESRNQRGQGLGIENYPAEGGVNHQASSNPRQRGGYHLNANTFGKNDLSSGPGASPSTPRIPNSTSGGSGSLISSPRGVFSSPGGIPHSIRSRDVSSSGVVVGEPRDYGNGSGAHHNGQYHSSERRVRGAVAEYENGDQRGGGENEEDQGLGLPTVTTSRISGGGLSAASVLRKYRTGIN